jgi:hypothetical protein
VSKAKLAVAVQPKPTVNPQVQMGRMRARLIARYQLAAVPGRPEELIKPGTDLGVSLGYGCKTIRVRGMVGRCWLARLTADFQLGEGWGNDLYRLLDAHFMFVAGAPREQVVYMDSKASQIPHPMDSFPTVIMRDRL